MKKIFFKTFGCRTNIFDTEVMRENLQDFVSVSKIEEADLIAINSCTVTNSADSNVRQFVRKAKRDFPKVEILFTGCGVKNAGKELLKNGEIEKLFTISEKEKIEEIAKSDKTVFEGNPNHLDKTIVTNFVGRSRAFVKIQEGCNFTCSYCIIPSVRGKSRSYPETHILKQVEEIAQNGFKEIVLTGTNIGSFGDGRNSLAKLLKQISQVSGIERVRLGSVEPSQIGEEFLEILNEEWLGRYLHIALQYTDDRMLKIMNRRNRLHKDLELFQLLSQKGYALGTDFIVGHGGETDEIFENAFQNLEKFPLTHIHLFRYSQRDGTPSAKFKLIDSRIVKERFSKVEKLIEEKSEKFKRENQEKLKILVEEEINPMRFKGFDQFFFSRQVESLTDIRGEFVFK
jgi:threonylcarbamoyladenosine tRNA methylthiotransferase MtaB